MSTQIQVRNTLLARARASLSSDDCMAIYDEWATSYNEDVAQAAHDYVAPALVAQIVFKSSSKPTESWVLDAGCGTGLVGQALALGGVKTIDGLDLSPAMLKVAKETGVYQNLTKADLTRRIEKPDETYDIVTCVGTFTHGHVGPSPALREFIRITKYHGLVIVTVIEDIWVSGGFKAEVEKMASESLVQVIAEELIDYVKGRHDKAMMIVLERISST
ncbi:S-adenosyl-L-methionine-dependent methyltransferase [Polychaeton citri CBS 116435]|uniref:S-adenosyl-L-methionine-dependent methyltransferase n=1 Tax=Polychaeton citri CBS 116435 TaxID=1314669 RepID=A0A9P4UTV5_9PEZI|nr:S-adenosyl-L-methionine-dependent methyltransferase [Polychaeton citri CBS 116435]